MGAVLVFGFRICPAIAAGAFAVNFLTGIPLLAAVGIAIGNTVGPLSAVWLLRRLPERRPSLRRLRDVLALGILGALCGPAVSATVGASVLFLTSVSAWSGFASAWLMWWLGDAMGVLIVTPLVLTFSELLSVEGRGRVIELACLLVGTVSISVAIFDPRLAMTRPEVFAFGVFPFVLWGAIRFEPAGAAIVSFLIAAFAAWGTAHGFGPFTRGNALQNAMLLESFLGVTAASGIVLATVIAERAQLIRAQSTREAVERSEKNYREIVETAHEGIWKIDKSYNTSFVNHRVTELLGYSASEILGKPLSDFLFEGDAERGRLELRRGASEQLEARYRRKDGSVLWARVSTSPVIGADGAFEGALAMISDISEQKRGESDALRSRATIGLLSRAVEQTGDSVIITDRQGTIEYVNPAFEMTTGYSREEAVGRTPRILKSAVHDEQFYRHLWDQIRGGEAFRGTLVNRKKGGELFWAEQTITPIKDSTGTITDFVSVLKDMTESRKRQEQDLHLRLAREVQQRFYSGAAMSVAAFDLASVAYPAVETGGDYLDVFSLPGGRTCIGIGDVSGHGLGSALVMALTRAYVRAFAQVETDPATILTRVNQMLVGDLEGNRFVTVLLVCLDESTGCLSYAGAGHIPGFLMNDSGEIDCVLESAGLPLGLFPESHFVTSVIRVVPKQILILMTDGITEMTTPEEAQFGTDRVLEYVRAHRRDSTRELVEGLYRAGRTFAAGNPQQDDVTEVIVRVA